MNDAGGQGINLTSCREYYPDCVYHESEANVEFHYLHCFTPNSEQLWNSFKSVIRECYTRCLDGDVRPSETHSYAHVSGGEAWCIIDTVSPHHDPASGFLQ